MTTDVLNDRAREARLRRLATRQGFAIHKSRARNTNLDDYGGYMIVDPYRNLAIAGFRFELDLDDVEKWLTE